MMTAAMEAVIEAAADLECGLVGAMVANDAIATTAADILQPDHFGYADIMSGKFSTTQWSSLTDAQQRMAQLPMVIDEQRGLGVAEIASRARRIRNQFEAAGKRLDIIAIDYLGLVRATTTYRGQRVNEIAEISTGLKAMAQELDCCVICLQQLSRQLEQRDNKRPTLSDLRDSGALEQDADLVAFVYRDEYYAAREQPATDSQRLELEDRIERSHNVMEFIIAKQRNGPVGTVRLLCDVAHAAVREVNR